MLVGLLCTSERRRTVTSWFRAGGIGKDFRRGYRAIGSVGRAAAGIAGLVLADLQRSVALADAERFVFAEDGRHLLVGAANGVIYVLRLAEAISRSK